MTNKEILIEAIDKAKSNGYVNTSYYGFFCNVGTLSMVHDILSHNTQYRKLLFSHEFAKAFFGEECECVIRVDHVEFCNKCAEKPSYRHHLQQMVISDDPIQYLKQFYKMINKTIRNIVWGVLLDEISHERASMNWEFKESLSKYIDKYTVIMRSEMKKIYNYFGIEGRHEMGSERAKIEEGIQTYIKSLNDPDKPRTELDKILLPKWWFDHKDPSYDNLDSTLNKSCGVGQRATEIVFKLYEKEE